MGYLKDLAQLLFPSYCAACEQLLIKDESGLCLKCQVNLPLLNISDKRGNKIEMKFWGRADVQMATALLRMTKHGQVNKIIHELKYHDNRSVGHQLGKLFGISLNKSHSMKEFDYIIPVPLHPKKLAKRGYNQCDCIADGIGEAMNIPTMKNHLIRVQYNDSQTRKSRYKRWENVEGIFQVAHSEHLENKKILLIDDVITTGSTIEACAVELNKIAGLQLSIGGIAMSG